MARPAVCDLDSEEGAQGLWATMGPTAAFWVDFPEQEERDRLSVDQVSIVVVFCPAPPCWSIAYDLRGDPDIFNPVLAGLCSGTWRNVEHYAGA